ncbi:MAG: hypothetical protein R2792_14130 [Saprospiraceae bacterium]
MRKLIILSAFLALSTSPIWAQISVTAGSLTYSQNFNSLSNEFGTSTNFIQNGTLPGWYSSTSTYLPDDGTGLENAHNHYAFGSTTSSERAFGMHSNNSSSRIGVRFKNDQPTDALGCLTIVFTGEQWNNGNNDPDSISVGYQISSSAITSLTSGTYTPIYSLTFLSPVSDPTNAALEGNLPENRTTLRASLSVSIPAGHEIMIRWTDHAVQTTDDGLGIDDVYISFAAPGTQAFSVSTVSSGSNSVDVAFGRGTGTSVIALMKADAAVDADPVDGVSYTANSTFGSGSEIGTGNYVVFIGDANTFSVSGLTNGTTYHLAVYEFSASCLLYKTPGAVTSFLPIELRYFSVLPKDKHNELSWGTASEQNNDYFSVERGSNTAEFLEIGKLAGAGTSHSPIEYNFTDENPLSGINYYRLKQVDFDGTFSYSPIRAVRNAASSAPVVYPSLATDLVYADFGSTQVEEGNYQLFDAQGKLVKQENIDGQAGLLRIETTALPAGPYFIHFILDGTVSTARFIRK